MRCPGCNGSLLKERHQYVEFDVCHQCRGIWVSGEQFHKLAVMVASEGNVPSSDKLTFKPRTVLRSCSDKLHVRNCPQCNVTMLEFNYAYDSNIFLDRCDTCKGLWLDANEIIDIAKHIRYNPDDEAIARFLTRKNEFSKEVNNIEDMCKIVSEVLQVLILLP